MLSSTPLGSATGYLAILDMIFSKRRCRALHRPRHRRAPRPAPRAWARVLAVPGGGGGGEGLATPRPFMTRGMSSRPLYTRSPGFDTRSRRSITGFAAGVFVARGGPLWVAAAVS